MWRRAKLRWKVRAHVRTCETCKGHRHKIGYGLRIPGWGWLRK